MRVRILFIERKRHEFVSIEKVFRQVARGFSEKFVADFQQVRFGNRLFDTIRNLLTFRARPADIYHITGHINYLALILPPEKTVLSIMDVRFLRDRRGLRRQALAKLYLDWPVRRLSFITTISEQVRREIIEHTGCEPAKIRVIENPLFDNLVADCVKPFDGAIPVILQVGTMPNKNLERLAEALSGLRCRLRVVGRLSYSQLAELGRHGVAYETAADLDDDAMKREYAACDIVAFCSTYEGFGLPIIEAQAMRKPVITSNISPTKDVAGGAACLVDPYDPADIREGVLRVIADREYREKLIAAGAENVKRFEASAITARYERLYDEMIGSQAN